MAKIINLKEWLDNQIKLNYINLDDRLEFYRNKRYDIQVHGEMLMQKDLDKVKKRGLKNATR